MAVHRARPLVPAALHGRGLADRPQIRDRLGHLLVVELACGDRRHLTIALAHDRHHVVGLPGHRHEWRARDRLGPGGRDTPDTPSRTTVRRDAPRPRRRQAPRPGRRHRRAQHAWSSSTASVRSARSQPPPGLDRDVLNAVDQMGRISVLGCPGWPLYTPEGRRAPEILFVAQSSSSRKSSASARADVQPTGALTGFSGPRSAVLRCPAPAGRRACCETSRAACSSRRSTRPPSADSRSIAGRARSTSRWTRTGSCGARRPLSAAPCRSRLHPAASGPSVIRLISASVSPASWPMMLWRPQM